MLEHTAARIAASTAATLARRTRGTVTVTGWHRPGRSTCVASARLAAGPSHLDSRAAASGAPTASRGAWRLGGAHARPCQCAAFWAGCCRPADPPPPSHRHGHQARRLACLPLAQAGSRESTCIPTFRSIPGNKGGREAPPRPMMELARFVCSNAPGH